MLILRQATWILKHLAAQGLIGSQARMNFQTLLVAVQSVMQTGCMLFMLFLIMARQRQ